MGDYLDGNGILFSHDNPNDWVCPYCLIRFKDYERYKYSAHIKICPKKLIKK